MEIEVYIERLDITVTVSESGVIELPDRFYTVADLRKIAKTVSKSLSRIKLNGEF